jgi:hypothetical protein
MNMSEVQRNLVVALVGFLLPAAVFSASDDDQLSVRILNTVPTIDTEHPSFQAFQLDGTMNMPITDTVTMPMRFSCRYRGPGDMACAVTVNGVPIYVGEGSKSLLYDPSSGLFQYPGTWHLEATRKETFLFEFGPYGGASTLIKVDIRPFLDIAKEQRISRLGGDRYRLSGVVGRSDGIASEIEYRARIESPVEFEYFRLFRGAVNYFEVSQFVADEHLPVAQFKFPQLSGLVTSQKPKMSFAGLTEGMANFLRCIFLRAGLNYPEVRLNVEERLGHDFDWDEIAKRDNMTSSLLVSALAGEVVNLPRTEISDK